MTRQYRSDADGSHVIFVLTTSENPKTVYRAGADVPFLGNGYENVPLSPDSAGFAKGRNLAYLRRGDDGWLQTYVFGERRGVIGNGVVGWGFAVLDTVLGRPDDYYLLRVMLSTTSGAPQDVQRAVSFADVLFPRIEEWYAAQPDLNRPPITPSSAVNTPFVG
jgi:hypothetical protein